MTPIANTLVTNAILASGVSISSDSSKVMKQVSCNVIESSSGSQLKREADIYHLL